MTDNEIKTRTVYIIHNKNSKNGRDSYIGSTSTSLESRLNWHKFSAKKKQYANTKVYRRINEVGWENWEIVPLLTLECTKNEILILERKWLEVLGADLNSRLPILTEEDRKKNQAEYRKRNREKIRQGSAEYRMKNRKEISKQQAEYRANNYEEIRKRRAERYANNQNKILKQQADRCARYREQKRFFCKVCDITCDSAKDLRKHNETLKHQYAFLNSLD